MKDKKFGKDGRSLSYFQSSSWMKKIGKNRKYLNQARGEESGVAKITAKDVLKIREHKIMTRESSRWYGRLLGIHPSYVYHLRSSNPRLRKWKHLDHE